METLFRFIFKRYLRNERIRLWKALSEDNISLTEFLEL